MLNSLLESSERGTIGQMEIELEVQHAVRILLNDDLGRVLLYQGQDPANTSDIFWCPINFGVG